jgi:hypothetical protein
MLLTHMLTDQQRSVLRFIDAECERNRIIQAELDRAEAEARFIEPLDLEPEKERPPWLRCLCEPIGLILTYMLGSKFF